jgi:hypothetical protein
MQAIATPNRRAPGWPTSSAPHEFPAFLMHALARRACARTDCRPGPTPPSIPRDALVSIYSMLRGECEGLRPGARDRR